MDVELYADPSCPWSWAACLWLEQVAPRRQLRLVHRPFSLALRDGTAHLPPPMRRLRESANRALRVAAAIEDEARWRYFVAISRLIFDAAPLGSVADDAIEQALRTAGVDPAVAAQAGDPGRDDDIRRAMSGVAAVLPGSDPTTQKIPVLVLDSGAGRVGFHGPLLDPVPAGAAALNLWDALEAVTAVPGVYELSRPRPRPHSFVRAAALAAH